jgi:protein-S-isoprenylcysteine O-methyltransferase Ste14
MPVRSVVGAAWILFWAYWGISAIGVKKNVRRRSWRWEIGVRVLAIAAILVIVRVPGSRAFFRDQESAAIDSIEGTAGVILCIGGLGLAVWARRHLGRNWGMPMSFKEGHELVTTGPYRYVRHPIYTGMLLGLVGTALVTGRGVWVIFVCVAIYCWYSARTEEHLMLQQFPQQYGQYKKRSKAFIPFVL